MMEENVYLTIFDKTTGQRKTSFTIIGEVHGKTIAELEKKASIGTALDLDKDYSIKDKPKTSFRFYNEESIQVVINGLENLKLKLREIKNK